MPTDIQLVVLSSPTHSKLPNQEHLQLLGRILLVLPSTIVVGTDPSLRSNPARASTTNSCMHQSWQWLSQYHTAHNLFLLHTKPNREQVATYLNVLYYQPDAASVSDGTQYAEQIVT